MKNTHISLVFPHTLCGQKAEESFYARIYSYALKFSLPTSPSPVCPACELLLAACYPDRIEAYRKAYKEWQDLTFMTYLRSRP